MHRTFMRLGSLLMACAVLLGAFGAHRLKALVDEKSIETYQTGVLYHMVHALAIIIAAYVYRKYNNRRMHAAILLFILGIVCFSGSLYAIVIARVSEYSFPSLFNLITPLGGLLFIAGWIFLFLGIATEKQNDKLSKESE